MNVLRFKRPSPTLAVAMVALFVALGGTAGAVVSQAVPLAKRALLADNAKKVGGQTPSQIVAQAAKQAGQAPGPASTAAGIVTVKTQAVGSLADDGMVHPFRISCDAGQKVISGGLYSSNNVIGAYDSYPSDSATWELTISHNGSDPNPANVSIYAVCIK